MRLEGISQPATILREQTCIAYRHVQLGVLAARYDELFLFTARV